MLLSFNNNNKNHANLGLYLLELLACDDLHSIIRLVLKAGNYMNAVSVTWSVLFVIDALLLSVNYSWSR